jgi:hypothetical protein
MEVDGTTGTTVWTDTSSDLDLARDCSLTDHLLVGESSRWAGVDTLATQGTFATHQEAIKRGGDALVPATTCHGDGMVCFHLIADSNTAIARYASVVITKQEGIGVVFGGIAGRSKKAISTDLELGSEVVDFTTSKIPAPGTLIVRVF